MNILKAIIMDILGIVSPSMYYGDADYFDQVKRGDKWIHTKIAIRMIRSIQ
jgi:hypothetical protein